jgi:hypothetical protein
MKKWQNVVKLEVTTHKMTAVWKETDNIFINLNDSSINEDITESDPDSLICFL